MNIGYVLILKQKIKTVGFPEKPGNSPICILIEFIVLNIIFRCGAVVSAPALRRMLKHTGTTTVLYSNEHLLLAVCDATFIFSTDKNFLLDLGETCDLRL